MKPKEAKELLETVENEGFDYCFAHYSEFKEIDDSEFHTLRLKYKQARQNLIEYLGIEDV